ncbi:LysR substrate-binding domain-containing protein [Roseibium marinum]|uniref:DNA-binding transcriptional LysR family regulator n=1 Tax=Roseibium marinum TaxID=281252 RepID=A0A2S3V480_9HYPH|nr:LysR substrate-binding domain-containing protein [Roseibium marinum]POF34583.1 DNA-binding transcriptional LysR family regulator [Roseibium marinum]
MDYKARALPPLTRLRPFEAAARLESFTDAATELGLTQTAVSKQVAALEDYLGVRLFERRNRAVFLTEEGRRFGRVVSAALTDIATEAAELRGVRHPQGLLLHCQLCEAFYWLMPRLSRFHERHPGVEVRVVSSLAPLTQAAELFDVAIQTSGRASGSAHLAFTVSDEIFPVAAPNLMEGVTLPVHPPDLHEFPLLSHRVIPQDWMDWPDWFDAVGMTSRQDGHPITFDNYPLVLQASVAGQGIALGWRRTVSSLLEEGKLIRPCEEVVRRPAEISVFRGIRPGNHRETQALLDWLQEEFQR